MIDSFRPIPLASARHLSWQPLFHYLLFFLCTLVGCTAIKPLPGPNRTLVAPGTFSHEDLDRVLRRFVDEQGRVDYAALKNDPHDLDRYYFLIASDSPDSHPDLFPTMQSKLAYWLNAYNTAVIKTVLTYYPISSVEDIRPPLALFFLPDKSGFFLFQQVTFGNKMISLYAVEHQVIYARFVDPRVHFALNCASIGCPRLPRQAFSAEHLDEQLDHEARKFLSEERNFAIDHEEKTVWLSSIFDWYEGDFLQWYESRFPSKKAKLLDYLALYVSPERAEELKRAARYQIRFVPYDWRLNDQRRRA